MYGLPEHFDGLFFVGCEVQMVAFAPNMVQVIFDKEIAIGIHSSYELRLVGDKEYVEAQRVEVPIASSRLMQLLGHKVATVQAEREGTLTLCFDGGHVFRCFDDLPNYESYSITHGKDEIFI